MKKALFIFAICVLAGCASKGDKAQKVAEQFLDAYISNDFAAATEMCSDSFKELFSKTVKDFESLDPQVKEMLKEQCAQLKYEISLVERVNKSDTFNISYNIIRVLPDSSSFRDSVMASTLKVVDGKVARLNK